MTRWLLALLFLGCVGCAMPGGASSLDPVPDLPPATLERTEDGRLVFLIRQGELVGLEGRLLSLPPGEMSAMVFYDEERTEPPEGEEPRRAALWLRGQGSRRHTLPSVTSPKVGVGTSDDWRLQLTPGSYELSVSMGARDGAKSGFVLVR
jgi:hypothetical protein